MKIDRQNEISDHAPPKHFGRSLPSLSKSASSWFILACSGSGGKTPSWGESVSGTPIELCGIFSILKSESFHQEITCYLKEVSSDLYSTERLVAKFLSNDAPVPDGPKTQRGPIEVVLVEE